MFGFLCHRELYYSLFLLMVCTFLCCSLSKLVVALTNFLLSNVGIDYVSVATYDHIVSAHLPFLEGRVSNFFFSVLCFE